MYLALQHAYYEVINVVPVDQNHGGSSSAAIGFEYQKV